MKKYCNKYLKQINLAKESKNPKIAKEQVNNEIRAIIAKANDGDKEAIVAYCYLQLVGFKIEAKPQEARERISKMITKHRNAEAMFFAAIAYYYGDIGYSKNVSGSEQWLREIVLSPQLVVSNEKKACAAYLVGELFRKGEKVLKDEAEAARFYELACQFGCKKSSLLLGRLYLNGADGIFGTEFKCNTEKGLLLLGTLADEGNMEAIEELIKYHAIEILKLGRKNSAPTEFIKKTIGAVECIEWLIR